MTEGKDVPAEVPSSPEAMADLLFRKYDEDADRLDDMAIRANGDFHFCLLLAMYAGGAAAASARRAKPEGLSDGETYDALALLAARMFKYGYERFMEQRACVHGGVS